MIFSKKFYKYHQDLEWIVKNFLNILFLITVVMKLTFIQVVEMVKKMVMIKLDLVLEKLAQKMILVKKIINLIQIFLKHIKKLINKR